MTGCTSGQSRIANITHKIISILFLLKGFIRYCHDLQSDQLKVDFLDNSFLAFNKVMMSYYDKTNLTEESQNGLKQRVFLVSNFL